MSAAGFVSYELMTPDVAAATAFYSGVVGWSAQDAGMPGMAYTLMLAGDAQVAGLMATPAELRAIGAPAAWSGYIAVDDVDAMDARVLQGGGKVLRPAADIPGIGRFSVVADPQGASFMLFKPSRSEAPPMPAPGAPGTVGWRELRAMDGAAVFDFYATLFGWTKGQGLDMGSLGTYQLFEIDGVPGGAVMTRTPDAPSPGWRYYFNVESVESAMARLVRLGGTVTMPPHEVPGGAWVLHGRDPQGALFALMSAAK
jgi:predicted enzyme related to lactoylglutathione lyase